LGLGRSSVFEYHAVQDHRVNVHRKEKRLNKESVEEVNLPSKEKLKAYLPRSTPFREDSAAKRCA